MFGADSLGRFSVRARIRTITDRQTDKITDATDLAPTPGIGYRRRGTPTEDLGA